MTDSPPAKRRRVRPVFLVALGIVLLVASRSAVAKRAFFLWKWNRGYAPAAPAIRTGVSYDTALVAAAREQTRLAVRYDPAYLPIPYPGGDVPPNQGVCSDVIVRAYRKIGIDLQKEVHEDMAAAFSKYPRIWGMSGPDPNIDHRRVPNLMKFFQRHDADLPISASGLDYAPGDIVAWNLGAGITHIGLVVDWPSPGGERFQIVHNIGAGPRMEDVLFDWTIIGHFRYPTASERISR